VENGAKKKDQEELDEDLIRGDDPQNEPGRVSADKPQGKGSAAGEPPGSDRGSGDAMAEENDPVVLRQLLAEQLSQAEEYLDRLVRLQADYDNFRRRTRQEKEEIYKYTSVKMISALLPVLDNFELALSAEGDSIESFKSGVQMIYKQLNDVLTAEGVVQIPAVGELFDPLKHEAVLRVDSDEYPDNTIIEELRRGYYLKDKVIRPSMVKVVKSI
jgi:molecular chaperone GrpE